MSLQVTTDANGRAIQQWDESGRGLIAAAYHRSLGYDPTKRPHVGFATFARHVDLAIRRESLDFPSQFRPMMVKAVEEILGEVLPLLDQEVDALIAERVDGQVAKLVDAALEPVRKAFAELKRQQAPPPRVPVGSANGRVTGVK